jgi:hypothetical protein
VLLTGLNHVIEGNGKRAMLFVQSERANLSESFKDIPKKNYSLILYNPRLKTTISFATSSQENKDN